MLGANLRRAREACGMTQAEVAEQLAVSRTTLAAIERGTRGVRSEELVELASIYGREVPGLLQQRAPVPDFGVQLRSAIRRRSIDADLLPHLDELERLCDDYLRLEELRSAPLLPQHPPEYDIADVDPDQAAEDIAASERKRLALGEGPLPDLRELLETQVGLRIFQLDLPSVVAGMFAFTEEHGGCIAVNRKHSPERRRQSLGHEYGHFLTSRRHPEVTVLSAYDRMTRAERFAETFGRAFLMPGHALRHRFLAIERERKGHPTHGDLCRSAHAYGVPVEGMTLRLEELGLIPAGTWERLQQEGFGPREAQRLLDLHPLATGDEVVPPRFVFFALEAWEDGQLSEGQLARLLRIDRMRTRQLIERYSVPGDTSSLVQPLAGTR
ncbi:MAG TPA: XRE family transcriptional regulator [Thermoanaerobaculia bacterium]|nr:XRE family transcriptional regulator [Thermoanaerobaculia bacterium]